MNIEGINPEEVLLKQLNDIKHQMVMFHLGVEERRKNWYFSENEEALNEIEEIRDYSKNIIGNLDYLMSKICDLDNY